MTDNLDQQQVAHRLGRIRLFRWSLLVVIVTFPLVVYLLTTLNVAETAVIATGVAWVAAGIILEFVIGFSRCPACRKHFHIRGLTGNFFAKKCMNCGIPLSSA